MLSALWFIPVILGPQRCFDFGEPHRVVMAFANFWFNLAHSHKIESIVNSDRISY